MTPERAKALEAVAEAARVWLNIVAELPYQNQQELDSMDACEKALTTLDALPAEPADAGEMVEMRAAIFSNGGEAWTILGLSHHDDAGVLREAEAYTEGGDEQHIAWLRVTARISRPVVPEVRADIEWEKHHVDVEPKT